MSNIDKGTNQSFFRASQRIIKRWKRAQDAEGEYYNRNWPGLINADSLELIARQHDEDRSYFLDHYLVDIDSFLPEKNCLDVGGGPNGTRLAQILHQRVGADVVSMDPLAGVLETDRPGRPFQLVRGAGESLPFRDCSFQVAFCLNVLDHVLKPSEVLKEIKRILANGGSLFLWAHSWNIPRHMRRFLKFLDAPHPHHFSHGDLLHMLRSEGYQITFQQCKRPKLSGSVRSGVSGWLSFIKYSVALILTNLFESSFHVRKSSNS